MIDFSFPLLRRLGLTPAMAQSLTTFAWSDPAPGTTSTARWMRATAIHRETVDVHDGEATHSARCSTRLVRDLQADNQELACGDWVLCAHDAHGQLSVHARIPPLNHEFQIPGERQLPLGHQQPASARYAAAGHGNALGPSRTTPTVSYWYMPASPR